ncbi:MAG: maltose ABC transporter permease MalF [Chloroflexia bacterium]
MRSSTTIGGMILRLGGLAILDAMAIFMAYTFIANDGLVIAIILAAVTLLVNYIFLDERVYPIRWLTPGLLLMLLMVVYPLGFTIYVALTNYSDGHVLTKEQVVKQLTTQYFAPTDAIAYNTTIYQVPNTTNFLVVFTDPAGNHLVGPASAGATAATLKPLSVTGDLPDKLNDDAGTAYTRLTNPQTLRYLDTLNNINFSDGTNVVQITGLGKASQRKPVYSFNSSNDQLTDNKSGVVFTPIKGTFTAPDGKTLSPGFSVVVGFENYARVITDSNIRGPFFGVFIWTFVFAFLSVLLTFSVGLGMAVVLNDKQLPFKGFFRALIIIPYAMPALISVLIWRGLLNPNYGQFSAFIANIFGQSPQWFIDGTWAKAGILLINTWLGYPYMMLICLGALQAIPTDMYEAADIDGASKFLQFRRLTLPLLLVSVAPLLIGSFAFNFNNFGAIEAYNKGGPAIPGASTPAGQTDILISYTFRLAFAGGQGADYGLASAIGLFIFLLVGAITVFNFRYTKQLEEVV